jgi:hypothetical protein
MSDRNPFAVHVPSALEALAVGDQSYKQARDFMQQRQQEQLRQRVAQEILNGGDTRAGIAQLIGVGDIAGATALGHFGKADTTSAIREYALSKSQGFPGTFMEWRDAFHNP